MARWLTAKERMLLATTVTFSTAGIGAVLWPEYALACAVIGAIGSSVVPARDLIVNTRRRRRPYVSPLATFDPLIDAAGSGSRPEVEPASDQSSGPNSGPNSLRNVLTFVTLTPDTGRYELDTVKAVTIPASLRARIRVANSLENVEAITRVNLLGYDGSPYGRLDDRAFADRKFARNRSIAARNPFAFMGLIDTCKAANMVGMTSVLPLTTDGARRYLTPPGVADNDITADMVAAAGEPFNTLLLFAITHIKLHRSDERRASMGAIPHEDFESVDLRTAVELVRLLGFQLGTILASSSATAEVTLYAQSNARSIQKLLRGLQMKTGTFDTADGEVGHTLLLKPRNVPEAAALLQQQGLLQERIGS